MTQHESAHEGAVSERSAADAWQAVVWNDPVNLMSYVTRVFMDYFGWARPEAEKRMREVHENGKSIVSEGGREQIERDVQAMHGYGLHATMRKADS